MVAFTPKKIKLFIALAVMLSVGAFGIQAQQYFAGLKEKDTVKERSVQTDRLPFNGPVTHPVLKALQWEDIDGLIRAIGTNTDKLRHVIELTAEIQNPAAVYLRGLLQLLDKNPLEALTTFDLLDIDMIPPAFLYPPYRLYRHVNPRGSNRYLVNLHRVIAAGKTSPLIQARVNAQEGDFAAAISGYLQTDPAQWTRYDVECLGKVSSHAGFHSEALRLIAGALKSGRVAGTMAQELRRIAVLKTDKANVREFKRLLKEELVQNSGTAKIVVSSVTKLLETRKLFLQRDYKTLLERYRQANPIELTTESILVLFLSAVNLKNRPEMDRWGQEIKRRYPNRETANWIYELTAAAK